MNDIDWSKVWTTSPRSLVEEMREKYRAGAVAPPRHVMVHDIGRLCDRVEELAKGNSHLCSFGDRENQRLTVMIADLKTEVEELEVSRRNQSYTIAHLESNIATYSSGGGLLLERDNEIADLKAKLEGWGRKNSKNWNAWNEQEHIYCDKIADLRALVEELGVELEQIHHHPDCKITRDNAERVGFVLDAYRKFKEGEK